MTSFEIQRLPFDADSVRVASGTDRRLSNWPVVYALNDDRDVYVGETLNLAVRMRQHLESDTKSHLQTLRIVVDETFNKSVCLDLESSLIRLLAGDGRYRVLNRNEGITDADYYGRADYRATFREIFAELEAANVLTRPVPEIENDDLFKLSPFKALNPDQAVAIEDILEGLFADIESGTGSTIVIQGDPGTGKTVVAIYLMKLLRDIAMSEPGDDPSGESLFSEFFASGYRQAVENFTIGLVVPQQSLRASIRNVFHKTPGLEKSMVLTPFDVGSSDQVYDLLIVDETHRLNQRANQPSGPLNKKFREITERLFGGNDLSKTQLDWVRARSRNQIFLIDSAQSVRPADLPAAAQRELIAGARDAHRLYPLSSQMRVRAGDDYVGYVRRVLKERDVEPAKFPGYDLRFFDDLGAMHDAIRARDAESGLARLLAGYAWPWVTKKDPTAFDIELDGRQLRWNRTAQEWITSDGALEDVGSIHTAQGYDLNYAGVIIGPDLRLSSDGSIEFDRDHYFDSKGKENNPQLGIEYSDDDLLQFVTNIYAVLLTRGIRGTFVYVVDPGLRQHLRQYFSGSAGHDA